EHEAGRRSDRRAVLPDQMNLRLRQRREDFVRPGQVELLHIGKHEDADFKGHDYLLIDDARLDDQYLAEMPKTPRFTPKPRRIEILAFRDVQLLDVAGPLQVFATANDRTRSAGRPSP